MAMCARDGISLDERRTEEMWTNRRSILKLRMIGLAHRFGETS